MPRFYYNADQYDRNDGDELRCHPLAWHRDEMEGEEQERRLYPAKMETGSGTFYCTEFDAICGKGDDLNPCGRLCDAYEPRNGKNGRCRNSKNFYDAVKEQAVVLRVDGKRITLMGMMNADKR